MNKVEAIIQFFVERGFIDIPMVHKLGRHWRGVKYGNILVDITDTRANVYLVAKMLHPDEDLDKFFNFEYSTLDKTLKDIDDFLLQLQMREL